MTKPEYITEEFREFIFTENIRLGISMENRSYRNLWIRVMNNLPEYRTMLDIGAGTGVFAILSSMNGKTVHAIDHSIHNAEYVKDYNKEVLFQVCDFTEAVYPQVDLASSIEVFEHLTDEMIDYIMNKVKCEWFLFSSTPENKSDDLENGHINIKTPEEWDLVFAKHGYILNKPMSAPAPWAKLYHKT